MTTPEQVLADFNDALEAQREELIALRQEIHAAPDLSGHEGPSSRRLVDFMGLPARPAASEGFVVRLPGSRTAAGRGAVAVRTELDALPIQEQTGSSFAASNGAMHACGHDVHQAAFAGFMRAAASLPELPMTLVGLGQPREETYPSGALDMVTEGLLESESFAAVLGFHVHPGIPEGSIATGAGDINASADEFHIDVIGRGGHGAYPHLAVDPVPPAIQIMAQLLSLPRTRVDPVETATVSIGALRAGQAANVIPDSVRISGTVRAMKPATRELLQREIEQVADLMSRAAGCRAEVRLVRGEPVLHNDAAVVSMIDPWLEASGLRIVEPLRSCGADDFSFFTERAPGAMCFVGVRSVSEIPDAPLHSDRFLPPDETVMTVARAMAASYAGVVAAHLEKIGE